MPRFFKPSQRIRKAALRVSLQIAAALAIMTVSIVFVNSSALRGIYAFAEIVNMDSVRAELDDEDPFSYEYFRHLDHISDNNYYLIEVFDEHGNVVYSNSARFLYSGEMSGVVDDMYIVGEVVNTMNWIDDSVSLDNFAMSNDSMEYLRYRTELKNGDMLRIWLPSFQIERNAGIAALLLTAFIVFANFSACALIIMFSTRFTHPVAVMSEITDSMAKLDFGKKCRSYSQPDVDNLGKNINALSDSLSETLDELQDKNLKLTEELEHSALIDESRKSFIANVSHELKTPIAIIRGYAEGLKLGINSDPQSSEEYCDIILEESDKMNRIVMDLLNLERIESGSYVPVLEQLDLSSIVRRQLAAFSMIFEELGIKVQNFVEPDMTVHSDEKTILLVLQNFLSNAASNIDGKRIVRLTLADEGENYRLSVYNSGDGIKDSELEKIWYSFYKTTQKRKDEAFHFGLGLPVVKAVQKRLNKECGVANEHGGVRFWFDIGK